MSERDPNELGALWIKQGGKGEYMTGKIGDQPVVVFRNGNKKEGSNQPDWKVMKPQKREDRDQDQRVSHPSEPVDERDIPF